MRARHADLAAIDMSDQTDRASLLLVDDDATFRQVLSRALEKRGFAVSSAADVDIAIALAAENPPEYAVIDPTGTSVPSRGSSTLSTETVICAGSPCMKWSER